MGKFSVSFDDLHFNLFSVLKIEQYAQGMNVNDLKEIIAQYHKFAENEVFPCRQSSDEEGVHLVDKQVRAPKAFQKAARLYYENGWFGLSMKEEIGGIPAPDSLYIACLSGLTGANVSFSMYPGLSRGALNVILQVGSEQQKNTYVEKMMTGQWGGTMCLTESGAGSDVGALKTTATPTGNGKYKIKGVKQFISGGDNDLYENLVHLVLARTPGGEEGTKGISLFIVPKINSNGKLNDVICTKIEEKMGLHASATCELTFGANDQCEGELIGKEFEGMKNMFIMMNEARLLCSIQGESQANLAYEMSLSYAKERSQFKTEIIHHPDVKRLLLEMRSMSRGLRSLCLYTANLFDEYHHHKKAECLDEIGLLTPICKSFATDEAYNVATAAIQVHGGYGYCTEYGIEQFARDIKVASIYEGTNAIQALDFVFRKIFKDKGEALKKLLGKMQKDFSQLSTTDFAAELGLIQKNFKMLGDLNSLFGKLASQNQVEPVQYHSYEFLNFCSNLIVAWRHACSATVAIETMQKSPNSPQQAFLNTKVEDFRIFCQHYLSRNLGLYHSMTHFGEKFPTMNP